MNTDIKLMITLAGNQRLPHYEAAIFANHELTCYYFNALYQDVHCPHLTHIECARAAYGYARHVIKGRWPEAEPIIARNADYACRYAKHVIKSKYPGLYATRMLFSHYS